MGTETEEETWTLDELREYCAARNLVGPDVEEHPTELAHQECYCQTCLSYND